VNERSTNRTTIIVKAMRTFAVIATVALSIAGGGSLAAAVSSALPPGDGTGSLTIHKFYAEHYENLRESSGSSADAAAIPADAQRVAGVAFRIERIVVDPQSAPTLDAPRDPAFAVLLETTDQDGQIRIDGLLKGFYRITEIVPAGQKALSESFLVKIPMETGVAGEDLWNWNVHVFPKNTASEQVIDPAPRVIVITKLSREDGRRLAGARFKIAASKTAAYQQRFLTHNGEEIEVVTGIDGIARIEIPADATYYLVETKAPVGYVATAAPIEVAASNNQSTGEFSLTVYNREKQTGLASLMPKTGDALLLSVAALMCASLVVSGIGVALSKRNEKRHR
jgi:hypothetical protein